MSSVTAIASARKSEEVSEENIVPTIRLELQRQMARGVKLSQMAKSTGLCSATVSNILYGVTLFPRWQTILTLLHYLGYSVFVRR